MKPPYPLHRVDVSVSPGTRARALHVRVVTDPAKTARPSNQPPPPGWGAPPFIAPPTAAQVVERFARAVRAGCFSLDGSAASAVLAVATRHEGARSVLEAELQLSPSPEGAVRALAEAFRTSVFRGSGIEEIAIVEALADPGAALGYEHLALLPRPRVPFRVNGEAVSERKAARVLVTLARGDDEPALDALREIAEAWGDELSWGAFSGGDMPFSAGFVGDAEPVLAKEVVIEIESFFGGPDVWNALLAAVLGVHARVCPVESVEIG